MSTLKAARADNFYYPPDEATWSQQRQRMRKTQKRARNYFKSSSLQYTEPPSSGDGSDVRSSLGDLALFSGGSRRGTVIRFEMPFKVICLKCGGYIAKGVRFDAERKVVGKYFSTTIYAFLMSCQHCHNPIVIQTDPENTEYLCKVGIRRKVESFDTGDAQTLDLGVDHAAKQQLLSNPFFKLECLALDVQPLQQNSDTTGRNPVSSPALLAADNVSTRHLSSGAGYSGARASISGGPDATDSATVNGVNDKLEELLRINEVNSGDWYLANSALRKRFRTEKKNLKIIPNFGLDLVNENEQDIEEARRITFLSQSKQIRSHFKCLLKNDSDIFSRTCASSSHGKSTIETKRKKLQYIRHIDSRLQRRDKRSV